MRQQVTTSSAGKLFADKLRDQTIHTHSLDFQTINLLSYAKKYHLSYHTRNKLTFNNRPYLIAIYEDTARCIYCMKSAQSGFTEYALVKTFTRAEAGLSILYVLPSQPSRNTFVPNRVDKLINQVPHYEQMIKTSLGQSDATTLKHFGRGTIKFVGSNTSTEFKEFPADCVYVDERDECIDTNIDLALSRIKESKVKEQLRFSTPTAPETGIDADFSESDKKQWFIKCERCNHKQPLDWFKNFVEEYAKGRFRLRCMPSKYKKISSGKSRDASAVCVKCNKPLNRLSEGEWVKEISEVQTVISGYHLSQLFIPSPDPEENLILELYKHFSEKCLIDPSKYQIFFNDVLGLPYSAEDAKLSDFILSQAPIAPLSFSANSSREAVMGVDVGKRFHVWITASPNSNGVRQTLHVGSYSDIWELKTLIRRYNIICCVFDSMPETHLVKEFQDQFPNQVYLCNYATGRVHDPKSNEEENIVLYDRTQSMDSSHSEFISGKVTLPPDYKTIDNGDLVSQLLAPVRVYNQKKQRYEWREGSKADHYRHAFNYCWIAYDLLDRGITGSSGMMVI